MARCTGAGGEQLRFCILSRQLSPGGRATALAAGTKSGAAALPVKERFVVADDPLR